MWVNLRATELLLQTMLYRLFTVTAKLPSREVDATPTWAKERMFLGQCYIYCRQWW